MYHVRRPFVKRRTRSAAGFHWNSGNPRKPRFFNGAVLAVACRAARPGRRRPFGRLRAGSFGRHSSSLSLRAEGRAGKSKAFGAGPVHGQEQGHTEPRKRSTESAEPRMGKPPVPYAPSPYPSPKGRGNNGRPAALRRAQGRHGADPTDGGLLPMGARLVQTACQKPTRHYSIYSRERKREIRV